MKMPADRCIVVRPPFPLTGKGRDRGAREPIKPITPTFVLPRRGEGKNAPSFGCFIRRPITRPQPIFEGAHEGHEVRKKGSSLALSCPSRLRRGRVSILCSALGAARKTRCL